MTTPDFISNADVANEGSSARSVLFGLRLETDLSLQARLAVGNGTADLAIVRHAAEERSASPERRTPDYTSVMTLPSGESAVYIYSIPSCTTIEFTDVAVFRLYADRITYSLVDDDYRYMLEIHLLGFVMSLFWELRGKPALHASAVVRDGRAVAFLANNRGGKSSIAAAAMERGAALLTDDVLVVDDGGEHRFRGFPAYPQMRMWPDVARRFVGHDRLPRVHPKVSKLRVFVGDDGFGSFHDSQAPLERIYVPERRDGGSVAIEPVEPGRALLTLLARSFLAPVLGSMPHLTQLHHRRLACLSELAQRVSVRRLVYPSGFAHMDDVMRAIEADARA